MARIEWQKATQILRAENPTPSQRGNPRNGGPGVSGPMGTKCPSAASPGDPLVTFPSLGKSLAARRQRNPPATNATIPSSPPHPSRLRRAPLPLLAFGHFPLTGGIGLPPGGRLKGSRRRNSPPLRKPAPPCFKRKTLLQYGGRNPSREGERPWNSTAWWPRPRAPSPTVW